MHEIEELGRSPFNLNEEKKNPSEGDNGSEHLKQGDGELDEPQLEVVPEEAELVVDAGHVGDEVVRVHHGQEGQGHEDDSQVHLIVAATRELGGEAGGEQGGGEDVEAGVDVFPPVLDRVGTVQPALPG